MSTKQLTRYFHTFLDNPPKPRNLAGTKHVNIKVDGKHFGRWGCTIVFKENSNIICWFFCTRENYRNYLYCFSKLLELGYIIDSVTSDKHGAITSVVKNLPNNTPHQYCTVHIQRKCQTLLTKKPETKAGKDLLEIVRFINKISSPYEKRIFLGWLNRYEYRWKGFINQRTYSNDPNSTKKWWYTHKNLRTAFRTLKLSTDNMFHYLDDPDVPKDTNGLEAEFTHLKNKLNAHRGLTRKRVVGFVSWYWYLKPTQNVH